MIHPREVHKRTAGCPEPAVLLCTRFRTPAPCCTLNPKFSSGKSKLEAMRRTVLMSRAAASINERACLGSLIEHTSFAQGSRYNVVKGVAPIFDPFATVDQNVFRNVKA